MSQSTFQAVSILVGAFAAGGSIGLSIFGIPTALGTRSPADKSAQLKQVFNTGHALIPPLFVATAATHLGLAWTIVGGRRARLEAVAGALTLAIVPYSIVVMTGWDKRMIGIEATDDEGVVEEVGGEGALDGIASYWARLNMVRGFLSLSGASVSFYGLLNYY